MSKPSAPREGEVWQDCDPRERGHRFVEIIGIDATHATVQVVAAHPARQHTLGKRRRIRLNRFRENNRGYRRAPRGPGEQDG